MNKENDKKLMIFDVFIDTQSQSKNVGISRTEFWTFVLKSVPLLSLTPSTRGIDIWSTSKVDFSTYNRYMDKPYWCPTNRETFQKKLPLHEFVTTPVTFNCILTKNHDFDDLAKDLVNILNLMCLKRFGVISKCAEMSGTWSGVL